MPSTAAGGVDVPLRSRGSVRQRRISPGIGAGKVGAFDEPQRQLLRQRHHGGFLEHAQIGADLPPPISGYGTRSSRAVRLRGNFLQSKAASQLLRLPNTYGL